MSRRRVAILYIHPLFGRGIAQLLQGDEQLHITCLQANLADTTARLRRLRPHAIIMETNEERALLWDAVRDLPPTLFIGVRLEDDVMDIYCDRRVMAACPENLFEAIHIGLSKRCQFFPMEDSAAAASPTQSHL